MLRDSCEAIGGGLGWGVLDGMGNLFFHGHQAQGGRIEARPASSRRRRLRIVPDCLVEVAQLKGVVAALGNLANDAGGLTGDDAEAGDDHVGGNDGAVENAHVVLDDGKLADGDAGANVHMAADGGGLDDGAGADRRRGRPYGGACR